MLPCSLCVRVQSSNIPVRHSMTRLSHTVVAVAVAVVAEAVAPFDRHGIFVELQSSNIPVRYSMTGLSHIAVEAETKLWRRTKFHYVGISII